MNKKEISMKIAKIKQADFILREAEKKKLQERDDDFVRILEELDNNYDLMVGLVKIARFEMSAKDAVDFWKLEKNND